MLVRLLIENRSIARLSSQDFCLLVKGCLTIDPVFSGWLKRNGLHLPYRDIVFCVLIRMYKKKEDIVSIFGMTRETYRTMKCRIQQRLGIGDKPLGHFLQKELNDICLMNNDV